MRNNFDKQLSVQDHKWSSTVLTVNSQRETSGGKEVQNGNVFPLAGTDARKKILDEMGAGRNSTNKSKITETSISSKTLRVDDFGIKAELKQKEELDEFSKAYHGNNHGQQIHVEKNLEGLREERRRNKLDMYVKIKTAHNPVYEKDEDDGNFYYKKYIYSFLIFDFQLFFFKNKKTSLINI